MSEGLNRIFSGSVSMARVNPVGIAMMIAAVVLTAVAGLVSRRQPEEKQLRVKNTMRLAASLICCAGAMIAILG